MRCCALPESTGWKLWNTDESKLRKLAECMWARVLERCDDKERARGAVDVIPEKYRIGNTGFTGMALVGDGGPGWNHPHKDRREIFGGCIVTLSGDVSAKAEGQGQTVFYSHGVGAGATLVVDHADGRMMVGPFDTCVHEDTEWKFERYVISFYVNAQILQWFEEVGKRRREGWDVSSCWD